MIHLGVIIDAGSHVAAWRHPTVPANAAWSVDHAVSVAKLAENGLFDMVFFADSLAVEGAEDLAIAQFAEPARHVDPLLLLSAIAAHTSRIGLVSTATTTYNQPYHVARMFASLDHISGGRAGWNLVTSLNLREAENFGFSAHPERSLRYERAQEFADVVLKLWESWHENAFVLDKATGQYFDPAKQQLTNHDGKFFRVKGPLNVPRSPQGRPVITQAGSSAEGLSMGAKIADVIFTAQTSLETGKKFAQEVRQIAAQQGGRSSPPKILPGVVPIVGRSRRDAQEKLDALDELIEPQYGLSYLSTLLGGVDLSGCDPDDFLPELPASNASISRQALLVADARRNKLTIKQLYRRACLANGHRVLLGSPEEIADDLALWYREGAADGFVLIPAALPADLEAFTTTVVPILQEQGLFRTAYEGTTLRQHLAQV